MSKELITDLEHIIEKKLELFQELNRITMKQREDIQSHQGDNIDILVQEKQVVIDRIDRLDESFLRGYKILRDELQLDTLNKVDGSRHPELRKIKDTVEKIMELAKNIMELEKGNNAQLEEIFQNIKKELKQINTGKRSLKAYEATPVYNDGVYIDKKVR